MNRSGSYKSNLSGEMMYKSFLPSALPPKPPLALDESLSALLVKANCAIAKLDWSAGKYAKNSKVYSTIAGRYAKRNVRFGKIHP